MYDSLKKKAISGVKWSAAATGAKTIIQLAKISVLTYLLEKSDFGIIAIGMMVIGFTEIFSNMGLAVGIIHKQKITEKQYASIYWLNLIASVFAFLLLVGATPLLSSFYNEPILNSVIPLLGIQIIINAIGKIHQTVKTKELQFAFISKITILSTFLGFVMTVILAYFKFGVFSLVWGQIFQVAINQGTYAIAGLKERKLLFYLNIREIKDFIGIGSYQLGAQLLDFVSNKIDVFLIGYFFGMNDLGVYDIAKDLVLKPYQLINTLINNVATATFAKIQDNFAAVKQSYMKMAELITNISFPLYMIIFIFADSIVSILYAPSFADVALFLRILVLVGLVSSINSTPSTLIIAKGRTDISFRWTIIRGLISTTMVLVASLFSIYFVAASQSFLVIVFFFIYWKIAVYPLSGISLDEYLSIFKSSLLISFFVAMPFIAVIYFTKLSLIASICLAILYGIIYILILIRTKNYSIRDLKQFIK